MGEALRKNEEREGERQEKGKKTEDESIVGRKAKREMERKKENKREMMDNSGGREDTGARGLTEREEDLR